jgi:hypothetical protein
MLVLIFWMCKLLFCPYLIKFFDRIRGAFTAAPTREEPVNHIPHAAPMTDKPKPNATPKLANPYGLMCVNTSDQPALQYSETHTLLVDDDMIVYKIYAVSDVYVYLIVSE